MVPNYGGWGVFGGKQVYSFRKHRNLVRSFFCVKKGVTLVVCTGFASTLDCFQAAIVECHSLPPANQESKRKEDGRKESKSFQGVVGRGGGVKKGAVMVLSQ